MILSAKLSIKRNYKLYIVILIIIVLIAVLGFTSNVQLNSLKQADNEITLVEYNKRICNDKKMVLVYFSADWCEVCAKMKPILSDIENEFDQKMEVLRIDTDRDKEITNEFEIDALPIFMLYVKGNRDWIYVGIIDEKSLRQELKLY